MTFTKLQQTMLHRDLFIKKEINYTYNMFFKKKINFSEHQYNCFVEITKINYFEMIQEFKQKQLMKKLIHEIKQKQKQ